jgi:peptidoglycan/xylan/chitin deacetylase (PgdA/CDA1 family)
MWLGAALYVARLHGVFMRISRRSPKVLVYHACDEEETAFTRGLESNTTPSHLARHLDFLARHYHVVSLDVAVSGAAPDGAVAITFDDGYRSVCENAVPLLEARGMTATVLLVTDVVGNEALVWVNELNFFLHVHPSLTRTALRSWLPVGPSATATEIIHAAMAHFDAATVDRILTGLRTAARADDREHFEVRLYVDWNDFAEMMRRGISFGSHTATHPNLTQLPPAAQRHELERARDSVRSRLGSCAAFAYPFGLWNESALESALAVGHGVILEVGGHNGAIDPHHVARIPVRATTDAELFAELEILAPVRSWGRRLRKSARKLRARVPLSSRPRARAEAEVRVHALHQ